MTDKYKIVKKNLSFGICFDVYYKNGLRPSDGWKHMSRFPNRELAQNYIDIQKEVAA